MTTQFDGIYHGLSRELGKFRIAASGMAWKGVDTERPVAMSANSIKWAQWLRVARNFQLRVGIKEEKGDFRKETFDGFQREDHDRMATLLKNHFAVTLETRETSLKGWNWGLTDFQGQDLAFTSSDRTVFELPLQYVANSNITGKTEVSLEFSNPSSTTKSKGAVDEMVEIRFYVPGTLAKLKGGDNGSGEEDNDDDEVSAAQVFHDMVKEKASLDQVSDDIVLMFEEVLVLTPRGRYDVVMFKDFLRLRGKTYDYKIMFSKIARLFLLPKDDQHVLFIFGLTEPLRQGQTGYQYLVMQFNREEETTAELNMTDEEIAEYDKLHKNYECPTYEVVSSLFRALAQKKIIGSGSFQSRDGHPGIKANLKAVQGDLFMLEKYVFFVSKQPTLIELSDIHQVVFSRVGTSMGAAAARTFDLKIVTKNGPEYTFSSINKEEHEPTESYFKDKKIRIKNEMVPDADLLMASAVGDDDEDMASVDSDDSAPRGKTARTGLDDDDSEDDEDFQASSSDEGSPSESDSSEGGAATASDATGDRDFAKKQKKKKVKGKEKESGATASKTKQKNGSDAEDDEEERPKKQASSKPKAKKKSGDDSMDIDDAPKPKPKPKPKAKAKSDAMDVDEERPRPKPKAKKQNGEVAEPPKKKQKTVD
ncbi:structure-specific recognition protein-domain-containing protein [Lentinula raphanica]|uniref:FACT complex subunit POB3 n=1 Tax=Lentinula raphanica TaxID=153919 RepID=A0AA38P847_9AGAR|nr:structure-specific recognition protein-domain-containing protein [Lentinula raphanica]